jgi:antitoxin (DNA-binding transcriptional repressor) of toxin-antitoxin stability system
MHDGGTMLEVGIKGLKTSSEPVHPPGGDDEILITDRGRPVARITGVDASLALDRLIARGVVTRPREPRTPIEVDRLIRTRGSVSDLVAEQRR